MEANFSNERALELTPQTWRWYKDRAPGGPLSQLAIHQFDVLHYLGGEISRSLVDGVQALAGRRGGRRPVDDAACVSPTARSATSGSCWTSPGIFAMRVFGSKGLMHYEIDFGTWDTPGPAAQGLDALHPARQGRLRQARGDRAARRATCSAPSWRCSRRRCAAAKPCELTAHNGNVAVAVVYAALRSIDRKGQYVRIADVMDEARANMSDRRAGRLRNRARAHSRGTHVMSLASAATSSISRSPRSPRS